MGILYFILLVIIVGTVFGALGRLAVPGPNPMSWGMTILVGIVGSLLGGFVARLFTTSGPIVFVLQVLGVALIVFLMQRRGTRVA